MQLAIYAAKYLFSEILPFHYRFRIILLTLLVELWLQVLLSSTEMVEVPIIGRKTQRIVSRVTRGLRLHKRQLGRFTQHLKPAKEIDPIPEGPRVLMPRITHEDMKKFIEQAADTVRLRFESTEPSIYRSGKYFYFSSFQEFYHRNATVLYYHFSS